VRGFVPSSQVSGISRGPETQKQSDMAKMVGSSMPLKVIEINRNRNRLILSERQAVQEVREGRKDELLTSLKEGDVRSGVVTSIADFGAFVDIGGADGLVHLSELSWSRVKHPSEVLKPGDKVKVYILSVDNDRKRIALSIKRTQNEPWTTVNERYQLGQVVEGTITQLATFGAFARIEDGVEGLIHVSEMGDGRVQHPRDVVQEGDLIQARIIRIDPARKRMGLSMRQPDEGSAAGEEVDTEESA
jgi:small subunit ribosomal protein S1